MISFRFITVGVVYIIYFWFNKNYWSNASRHPRATPRILGTYIQRVFYVQEYWRVCIALLLKASNLIFQTKREKLFLFDKLIMIKKKNPIS